ncbi:MAG: hypothetical protein QNJ51_03025 [Calothrix sp. MO_167.B12]|nr:hypothetical protein [Calothrix sp. MO_167.B12]
MAEFTINEVFGAGTQRLEASAAAPSSGLFIPDSVFTEVGLSNPSGANAEQLLASIVIKAKTALTETAFDADLDKSIYFETDLPDFINRGENNVRYRLDSMTIYFAKLAPLTEIDPNDY